MAGRKILSSCEDVIRKIVTELGYYLVAVEYKKQISGMVLEVVIDSESGITLNDCERVARALDEPLDEINPTNDEPYNLNISSMGLDRPITTEYQFKKYKNKKVIVKLYETLKPLNKKQFVALLQDYSDSNVTLQLEQQSQVLTLEKKLIAQIVPYIEF